MPLAVRPLSGTGGTRRSCHGKAPQWGSGTGSDADPASPAYGVLHEHPSRNLVPASQPLVRRPGRVLDIDWTIPSGAWEIEQVIALMLVARLHVDLQRVSSAVCPLDR